VVMALCCRISRKEVSEVAGTLIGRGTSSFYSQI
jgi:hypothetical protein